MSGIKGQRHFSSQKQRKGETLKRKRRQYRKDIVRETERKLLKNYGITIAQRDALIADQKGICPICGVTMTTTWNYRNSTVVDHDHRTGKVRAILCNNCNVGLGHFDDSITTLEKAVSYLKQHISLN